MEKKIFFQLDRKSIRCRDRNGEKYLNKRDTGEFIGEEADMYHGYYTIHTVTEEGDIAGILSVNGFTGQIWYHNWHGIFIDMKSTI